MPNIVIEKNGQTYRFGLHEDNSITNWQSVVIPYQGKDYYARIGDDNTPLKVTKGGREYSVQYNPVAFSNIRWPMVVSERPNFTREVFFPRGRYKLVIDGSGAIERFYTIGTSKTYTLHAYMEIKGENRKYIHLDWPGVELGESQSVNREGEIRIERLGD